MKIYLDVCCLNRPFDDQTQTRIHLEAEAVLSILQSVEDNEWQWTSSDAIAETCTKTPRRDKNSRSQSVDMATGGDGMNSRYMTMSEIRRTGIQLLTENLGAVGMVRFLQQNDLGWGDYTTERSRWLGNPSLDNIAAEIKATRPRWPQAK